MKKIMTVLCISSVLFVGCAGEKQSKQATEPMKVNQERAVEEPQLQLFQPNVEAEFTNTGVKMRVALMNNNDLAGELLFLTGQQVEIIIRNEKKEEVYRYSKDRSFTTQLTTISLRSNKTHVWEREWTMKPVQLEEGTYEVEATILVEELNGQKLSTEEKQSFVTRTSFIVENQQERKIEINKLAIKGKDGNYEIQGEYNGEERLFYAVEDGHRVLIEEVSVNMKENGNQTFTFSFTVQIAKENIPSNGVISLDFYTKEEDGTKHLLKTHLLEKMQ